MVDRILMFTVGAVFVVGGLVIAKNALDAKNLIETAMFGVLGLTVGLFLMITAFVGPPNY